MTVASTIRVFLVDDHEIVRRGVADLLGSTPGMTVVGEAADVGSALHRIPTAAPDVALLDLRLPDGTGIEICRELRFSAPEVKCLILTAYDDDEALTAAILAGAAGYALKNIRGDGLIESIRTVAAGGTLIAPEMRLAVSERLDVGVRSDARLASLSERERDVVFLVAEGLSNREIAVRLNLAEKTVKNYVSAILTKLDLKSRTQAAGLAWRARSTGTEF